MWYGKHRIHQFIIVPFRVLVFGIRDIDVLEVQAAQEKQRQVNGPLAKADSAEKRGAVVQRCCVLVPSSGFKNSCEELAKLVISLRGGPQIS